MYAIRFAYLSGYNSCTPKTDTADRHPSYKTPMSRAPRPTPTPASAGHIQTPIPFHMQQNAALANAYGAPYMPDPHFMQPGQPQPFHANAMPSTVSEIQVPSHQMMAPMPAPVPPMPPHMLPHPGMADPYSCAAYGMPPGMMHPAYMQPMPLPSMTSIPVVDFTAEVYGSRDVDAAMENGGKPLGYSQQPFLHSTKQENASRTDRRKPRALETSAASYDDAFRKELRNLLNNYEASPKVDRKSKLEKVVGKC